MYIVQFDPENCGGCGKCTHNCPGRMLGLVEIELDDQNEARKVAVVLGSMLDCMGCQSCEVVCEYGAVTLVDM